jgi:hypothetical protein
MLSIPDGDGQTSSGDAKIRSGDDETSSGDAKTPGQQITKFLLIYPPIRL